MTLIKFQNRLFVVLLALAFGLIPIVVVTRSRALALVDVAIGVVAVVVILWRDQLLRSIPPESPEDVSKEFWLLPNHPMKRTARTPRIFMSMRLGFITWLAVTGLLLAAAYFEAIPPLGVCFLVPWLFFVLVLGPWVARRSFAQQEKCKDAIDDSGNNRE
jgi:hypothetical protein